MSVAKINPGQRTPHASANQNSSLITISAKLFGLVGLFYLATFGQARDMYSLRANTIWSHLQTGIWILQNRTVPHSGLFSQSSQVPWVASNWGYDLLLGVAFKSLGLAGLPLVALIFYILLTWSFLRLSGIESRWWTAISLSFFAVLIFGFSKSGATVCAAILFNSELIWILQYCRDGSTSRLFWIPFLILIWANLDSSFVYGLTTLVLLSMTELIKRRPPARVAHATKDTPRPLLLLGILLASSLAAICSPYGYHGYLEALHKFNSTNFQYIAEWHALGFRNPQDYFLLLLGMSAFLLLGRAPSKDWFQIVALTAFSSVSFAIQRDSWLVLSVGIAVISGTENSRSFEHAYNRIRGVRLEAVAAGLAALIVLLAGYRLMNDNLMNSVGQVFPVKACDYIRDNHLPGPVFNEYLWGDFLMWYLPEYPVAIDSRTDMYGPDVTLAYFRLMNGYAPWDSDTYLAQARTVLLKRGSSIAQKVSSLAQFRQVYSDDMAVLFIRR